MGKYKVDITGINTNELKTLETIGTELDGLKSVTLDTKIRKLTK